jgi:hypothetical protein
MTRHSVAALLEDWYGGEVRHLARLTDSARKSYASGATTKMGFAKFLRSPTPSRTPSSGSGARLRNVSQKVVLKK